MATKTITQDVVLIVENCIECGIVHAIPRELRTRYQERGGFWMCPNGHSQGWKESNSQSATDKLRAELESAKNTNRYYAQRTNELHEQKEGYKRRLAATKGTVTKLKNRAANGVCPCCNRTFQNVQRHMTTKHPDFSK